MAMNALTFLPPHLSAVHSHVTALPLTCLALPLLKASLASCILAPLFLSSSQDSPMSLSIVSSQLVGYLSLTTQSFISSGETFLKTFKLSLFPHSSSFSVQVPLLSETALLDVFGNQHL